jgi:hypothetical protein
MYAQHMILYQQQKQAGDQAVQAGADPTMLPPTPQMPVPPMPIPRTMDQKILMVWTKLVGQQLPGIVNQLIMQQGGLVDPNQVQQQVTNFLRFRAVVEAYKLMQPQPMAAAPGSGATQLPGDTGQPGVGQGPATPPQQGGKPGKPQQADMGGKGQ